MKRKGDVVDITHSIPIASTNNKIDKDEPIRFLSFLSNWSFINLFLPLSLQEHHQVNRSTSKLSICHGLFYGRCRE